MRMRVCVYVCMFVYVWMHACMHVFFRDTSLSLNKHVDMLTCSWMGGVSPKSPSNTICIKKYGDLATWRHGSCLKKTPSVHGKPGQNLAESVFVGKAKRGHWGH